jgi:hypothetical protein
MCSRAERSVSSRRCFCFASRFVVAAFFPVLPGTTVRVEVSAQRLPDRSGISPSGQVDDRIGTAQINGLKRGQGITRILRHSGLPGKGRISAEAIIRATQRRPLRHKAGADRLHHLNVLPRERGEGRLLLRVLQQPGNGLLRPRGLLPQRVGCQGIGHFREPVDLHADPGRKLKRTRSLCGSSRNISIGRLISLAPNTFQEFQLQAVELEV